MNYRRKLGRGKRNIIHMGAIDKEKAKFQAGDIINVQGTGVISRLIRWVTNYDYSHTAMICCRLSSGEYLVIEMIARGIMIRPLSVYEGKKMEVFRVNQPNAEELGESAVLRTVDMITKYDYAFGKILYLGLILIPRRIFRRYPLTRKGEYNSIKHRFTPKGIYQVSCYYLTTLLSTVTFMPCWSAISRLISKDEWLPFTERVAERVRANKVRQGGVNYAEFVQIVEEEFELQKKAKKGEQR
jgi:hypothetical protein